MLSIKSSVGTIVEPDYAEKYEQLYHHHWWWRARTEVLRRTLRSMSLPKTGQVLDVGCGSGVSFGLLKEFGSVQGVEVSQSLADSAGPNSGQIHCAAFDETFDPGQRYSLITMLDVLEHFPDPLGSLVHSTRLLETDGRVLITVPAMPSCWTKHDELNHHFLRFTKRGLREMVSVSGLEVQQMHHFFHWLTPLKLAVRLKEALIETKLQPPAIPGKATNDFFFSVSRIEQRLFSSRHLPFGTSLLCVATLSDKKVTSR